MLSCSVPFPAFEPMPLDRAPATFLHPQWIFEIKWDGFRALLYFDKHGVRLVSRNANARDDRRFKEVVGRSV